MRLFDHAKVGQTVPSFAPFSLVETMHLLCLLDGLGHGEENAIDADGEHDHVVEVLVRAQVHAGRPDLGGKGKQS